jgi:hypothetical protein
MPTHVDWPIPHCVSSCTIWYVSVPERETRPTRPGEQISPGMIPTFDRPGVMKPGQLGPISLDGLPRRYEATPSMSRTAMPSVMHTISRRPASAPS